MNKLFAMLTAAVLVASVGLAQTLTVGPVNLAQSGTRLQGATAQSATVYNSGTGTSYYTVAVPVLDTWLSVSPATGSSTNYEYDTVTVTYVTTGLVAGIHTSTITVTQTNGTVQVKTIPIALSIEDDLNQGIAIGPSSAATAASGIAIGDRTGRAIAIGANTIQIGGGTNLNAGTTRIRGIDLLDSSGNLISARLPTAGLTGTKTNAPASTAITNISITTVDGLLTAITINGI